MSNQNNTLVVYNTTTEEAVSQSLYANQVISTGNFTPILSFSGATTGFTQFGSGYFSVSGSILYFNLIVILESINVLPTGSAWIQNLPYPIKAYQNAIFTVNCDSIGAGGLTFTSNYIIGVLNSLIEENTIIQLRGVNSGLPTTVINNTNFNSNGIVLLVSGTYCI